MIRAGAIRCVTASVPVVRKGHHHSPHSRTFIFGASLSDIPAKGYQELLATLPRPVFRMDEINASAGYGGSVCCRLSGVDWNRAQLALQEVVAIVRKWFGTVQRVWVRFFSKLSGKPARLGPGHGEGREKAQVATKDYELGRRGYGSLKVEVPAAFGPIYQQQGLGTGRIIGGDTAVNARKENHV